MWPKKKKKKAETQRYLYTHVHSSIIRNRQRWKQLMCPLRDKWINKCGMYINGILFSLIKAHHL